MADQRIAIYIRLSQADEDTGRGKRESNSVVNQRSLIHHFLDTHEELSGYPRTEFVDDGYTGTNTDRPAFKQMVAAIKDGKFSCCITKDFSRFARDYIEMGDYLEYLFPYLGVRYISINDGYDSNNHKGTTGGLDMVMRAIIYDAYSKDLSIKVKSGKEQGRKKGRRVGGYPGYGYMRDPNRRSMDIIDPEAAAVVRRIFEAAIEGMSIYAIAKMLNDEGILTPSVYFRRNHPETHKFANVSDKQYWNYDIVRDILKRYAYTGASVGGTLKKLVPCHKSVVATKAEEWIIVPGMHEAIVTTEEYELAQKIFSDRKFISSDIPSHPLQSIVVCSNCLRVMEWNKRTTRHRCRYGSYGGDAGCRAVLPPPKKELEAIVFNAIKNYIRLAGKEKDMVKQLAVQSKRDVANCRDSIDEITRRIDSLKRKKFSEYERYTSGQISKEAYLSGKRSIDSEIGECEAILISVQEQLAAKETIESPAYCELDAICEEFSNNDSLTYEMAHAFVDRILVYPEERIEIQWKFRDIFSMSEDNQ